MFRKTAKTVLLTLLLVLPAASLAAPAVADEGGSYQPYTPVAAGDQVSAPMFVVLAYSLIWVVLLGFVVSVWRRQRRVEAELEQLQRRAGGD